MVNDIIDPPDGSLLTGWILVAKYADQDNSTSIIQTSSETMDLVTHLGLAEAARFVAQNRLKTDQVDD